MTTAQACYPLCDLALSRRLERAEGRSSAELIDAKRAVFPDSGACWIEAAGAYAMFDGISSPCTQTFGLGMFGPVTTADMERIETFFKEHGAPVFHEVSPLADAGLLEMLNGRGYQPFELTSVMFRPIRKDHPGLGATNERLRVRLIRENEQELFSDLAVRGWEATGELADFVRQIGRISAAKPSGVSFLAELDGQAIATGALHLSDGVALLAGASTVPEGRRQGAQLALLECRLRYAAEQGCDLAMMGAAPGSASQRNAERNGIRIAYTRIKWRLGRAVG
jgi:hypothetical protein